MLQNYTIGKIRRTVFASLVWLAASTHAGAQTNAPNVFRPERGFQPTGSYSISDTESVSDTNGTVTVRLPVAKMPPGRNGSGFSLELIYNSALYDLRTQEADAAHVIGYNTANPIGPINMLAVSDLAASGGWRYNLRYSLETDTRSCIGGTGNTCTRMTLVMGDGSSHPLWQRVTTAGFNDAEGYSVYNLVGRRIPGTAEVAATSLTYYTTDGSFIRVDVTHSGPPSYSGTWKAVFPNGDYVQGPIEANGFPKEADQICDRNDHCTQLINAVNAGVASTTLVDAFDRRVVVKYSNPSALTGIDEIRVLAYGTNVATSSDPSSAANAALAPLTKVYWKHASVGPPAGTTASNATRGVLYECRTPGGTSYNCITSVSVRVVEKLELPTGLAYEFIYADDSAADADRAQNELLEMKLPVKTGESQRATVRYKWSRREKTIAGSSPAPWFDANINPLEQKVITWQEEGASGDASSAQTRTWGYNVQRTTSTVTAPDGGQTTNDFVDRGDLSSWNKGLVFRTSGPAGTTWRCWRQNEPWIGVPSLDPKNPYVGAEHRQPSGGSQAAKTTFGHDKNGNLMTTTEYDWVVLPSTACTDTGGTTLRKTENRYWNPPGGAASPKKAEDPVTETLTDAYWMAAAKRKRNSVLESRVFEGTVAKAVRQYEYDDSGTSGNVTRELLWDDKLSATVPGVASTAVTLTSANAAVTVSAYVPTSGRKGMVESVTDPSGNVTKYSYGLIAKSYSSNSSCPSAAPADYTDVYPTAITTAYLQGEAQIRKLYYDCGTGLPTYAVHESNQNARTKYSYDVYGRLTEQIEGDDQTDPINRRTVVTEYDDGNRRVRVVQDGKFGTVYHFNNLGELFRQRTNDDDATAPVTAAGNEGIHTVTVRRTAKLLTTDTLNTNLELASNPYRPTATSDATMGWTMRILDQAGRAKDVRHYRGAVKPKPFRTADTPADTPTGTETYSYPGATTTATDAAGKATSTTADALGRVLSASDGSSSASYKHTALDGLTEVTQTDSASYSSAKTQTRTFLYSSLGRLTSATNPEADSATTYTYFPNGTLKTKTDPRGVVTTYAYDRLNRPVKKDYSATTPVTPAVRYCYDGKKYDLATDACVAASPSRTDFAVGAVTDEAVQSGGLLISRTEYTAIDRLGRATASKQTTEGLAEKAFAYVYAAGGALAKVQYPSLRWVSYEVNGANRVKAVKNGDTGSAYYLQNASYKATGAMASATFGLSAANQWTQSWEYNSNQQAQKLRVKKGAQTLLGLDWIYSSAANYDSPADLWVDQGTDNNGNLRKEKLSPIGAGSVDRNYTYDGANRVTSYAETGKSQAFGFDAFGNVWQTSSTGVTAMPQAGPASYDLNASAAGVRNRIKDAQHDAAGNLQQYLLAGAQTASYDAEGRVSQISGGGVSATYTYDAGGRRVKREVGGSPTVYYVYGAGGELMAEYGGAADAVATKYLVADHLGSTRMVLDGAGTCQQRMDYAPFGAQVPRSGEACYTGAATNGIPEFTGKQRDGETAGTSTPGLDYFGARYMASAQGRFSSPDPLIGYPSDPQSWNMYAYARNNPLLYTDPTGMSYEICDTQGNCTKKDLSDSQFNQVRKDNKNQFFSNGKIFNRNDDGSSTQIGTYRRTGDDLPDSGVSVLIGLERRADASNKLIAGVAIGSAAVGVAGGAIAAGAGTAVAQSALGLGGNIGARLLPLGMTTAYFGQQVMRWGTGEAQALARAGTVTLQEMQAAGITRQMAQSWQQFYSYVAQMNPANPSAAGRAQLMQHVVELFDKGK